MTLTLDRAAKPTGLMPVKAAVARIAEQIVNGVGDESGSVQVLAADEHRRFRSQHLDLPAPLIVMFADYIELEPYETERVSRRVLFARDDYTCQYCGYEAHPGRAARELTMDHVKPARLFANRAEATTWENVTTSCAPCNRRKGGRLPRDCGMMPRCVPKRPHYVQLRFAGRLNAVQRDYVRDYFGDKIGGAL